MRLISLVYSVIIYERLACLDSSLQTDFVLDLFCISRLFKLTNFYLLEKLLDDKESKCNLAAEIKRF